MKVLLTGIAGFIGYHAALSLLRNKYTVIGIDNINKYYDRNLKYARLAELGIKKESIEKNKKFSSHKFNNLKFAKVDLNEHKLLHNLIKDESIEIVINLAAQAGVRYSLENPKAYIDSNISGFFNLLESCRNARLKHFVYASSSSVYGLNETMPFSIHDNVDHPISLYAASKKSNELMAHTYSYLFGIPTTGLRFFTVYGPWGRPDMALSLFTKAIIEDKKIDVYNNGNMQRDFTYIDDVVEGILRIIDNPPVGNKDWSGIKPDPGSSKAPYKIYNIGNNSPIKLTDFIKAIEIAVGKKAKKKLMPMSPGDVPATYADINELIKDFDYKPNTYIQDGINNFVKWYKEYYIS